jgi:hypothetical protein
MNVLDNNSKIPWYPKLLFQRENTLASFWVQRVKNHVFIHISFFLETFECGGKFCPFPSSDIRQIAECDFAKVSLADWGNASHIIEPQWAHVHESLYYNDKCPVSLSTLN